MAGVKGQRSGGHNAKPRDQLEREGTFDPSRHSGFENPLPVQGVPKPPAKLNPVGRREWRRMVALLEENGTLSRELASALFEYCGLFQEQSAVVVARDKRLERMQLVEESLEGEGEGALSGEGRVKAIECLTKLEQLNAKDSTNIRQFALAIRAYLVEFGLTPASRGRVRLAPMKRRPQQKEHEPTPLEKLQAAQRALRAV